MSNKRDVVQLYPSPTSASTSTSTGPTATTRCCGPDHLVAVRSNAVRLCDDCVYKRVVTSLLHRGTRPPRASHQRLRNVNDCYRRWNRHLHVPSRVHVPEPCIPLRHCVRMGRGDSRHRSRRNRASALRIVVLRHGLTATTRAAPATTATARCTRRVWNRQRHHAINPANACQRTMRSRVVNGCDWQRAMELDMQRY